LSRVTLDMLVRYRQGCT